MILGATGHRPGKLGGYGPDVQERLIRFARRFLRLLEPDEVIVRMALGWDQAVAWAAYHEGIPFRAYVPFEGQERQWPDKAQHAYKDLLFVAASVRICTTGGYSAAAMQIGNMAMVDDSDLMLTLWDGTRLGGTWNCIDYAQNRKFNPTPIANIWRGWVNQRL